MSTDLRAALRDAVTGEPPLSLDPATLAAAGGRRQRRRTRLAVGAAAFATAAALAVVVVLVARPATDSDPDPARTELLRLDIDDSVRIDLDVAASTRTAWDNDRDSLEYDRLAGITADGLVLRTRYSNDRRYAEIGLLDPATGTTDWLPTPLGRPPEVTPVELTADRLVLAEWMPQGRTLHLFDRGSRTWQRSVVHVTGDWELHVPPLVRMGPDDRVYVGSTMEGESGPMHWWSAPVTDGGEARPELGLDGAAVTWGAGMQLTAHPDGRVVLSGTAGSSVVTEERPAGCARPKEFPDAPLGVLLAGDVPVVTYPCEGGRMTVVYRAGEDPVSVRGVSALAGDDEHVVLATASTYLGALVASSHDGGRTYLLHLSDLTLSHVGAGPHEGQVELAADLLLWNTPGPGDTDDAYDVVWNVARLD